MSYKLTRQELADIVGCDVRTIDRYMTQGLPTMPREGGPRSPVYFDSADAMQWYFFMRWGRELTAWGAAEAKVKYLLERLDGMRYHGITEPIRPPWAAEEVRSRSNGHADA